MSKDKKSLGTLLLAILLFLAVAAGSWFYFSQKKDQMIPEEASLAETGAQSIPVQEDLSGHDHDHDHHGHDHAKSGDDTIATVGTVHDKKIDPILGQRALGDPEAPIVVREFFSLTCNHCADFHNGTFQVLKEKYIDTGKIYFIYEEFPLNGPALYGSMIARCLPKERYTGFIDLLLKNQDEWAFSGDFKSSLKQNAALAGMSEEDFEECFNDKKLQAAIGANIQEASQVWNIRSTPSFVFNNGERVMSGGKSIDEFDVVITELSKDKAASIE